MIIIRLLYLPQNSRWHTGPLQKLFGHSCSRGSFLKLFNKLAARVLSRPAHVLSNLRLRAHGFKPDKTLLLVY